MTETTAQPRWLLALIAALHWWRTLLWRIRQNIRPLYLVCAVVAFGHPAADEFSHQRSLGRDRHDAALIAALVGATCASAWPVYVSFHWWGRR